MVEPWAALLPGVVRLTGLRERAVHGVSVRTIVRDDILHLQRGAAGPHAYEIALTEQGLTHPNSFG